MKTILIFMLACTSIHATDCQEFARQFGALNETGDPNVSLKYFDPMEFAEDIGYGQDCIIEYDSVGERVDTESSDGSMAGE